MRSANVDCHAGAPFGGSRQLSAAYDRDVHLLRHQLEVSRYIGDLLNAVVDPFVARHELEIVYHDEAEILYPAQLRLHTGDRESGRVVDKYLVCAVLS